MIRRLIHRIRCAVHGICPLCGSGLVGSWDCTWCPVCEPSQRTADNGEVAA